MTETERDRLAEVWLDRLGARFSSLSGCRSSILTSYICIKQTFLAGGKLLICGNGGSAADAEHICGELMKGFLKRRRLSSEWQDHFLARFPDCNGWAGRLQQALPVVALVHNSPLASAIANDQGEGLVYAQQILGYGRAGDVLLAISTSGNSVNILNAIMVARFQGLKILGLTGDDGGLFNQYCDILIKVPAHLTAEIQELHLPVYHCICAMLEAFFFPDDDDL